jgi:hypothetical protein
MSSDNDYRWEEYQPKLPLKLETGEKVTEPVMRRRTTDGNFTYRRMTDEEMSDYLSREAW